MFDRGIFLIISVFSLFGAAHIGGNLVPDPVGTPDKGFLANDKNFRYSEKIQTEVSIRRSHNGLFHITALINGKPVDMAIDTGATRTIIAQVDAERLGLYMQSGTYSNMETLNGHIRLPRVKLDKLTIGSQTLKGIEVVLGPKNLNQSLVGLDAISRSGSLTVEGNRLTLLTPKRRSTSEQAKNKQ